VEDDSLEGVLNWAEKGLRTIDQEIRDYTCYLTKRERIHGRLRGPETLFLKVRHGQKNGESVIQPFSVYLRFYRPESVKNREAIFVDGRNENRMIVRNGGSRFGYITTAVPTNSPAALRESRYPITEIGVRTLTRRLIDVGQTLIHDKDCETRVASGATVHGRMCTLIQVENKVRKDQHRFKFVRIFIDNDLELPVRYVAYDWPQKDDGEPILLEEYTFTNFRLNVGLSDWDFNHRNDDYLFLKSFKP
jgi:hypothetical protein